MSKLSNQDVAARFQQLANERKINISGPGASNGPMGNQMSHQGPLPQVNMELAHPSVIDKYNKLSPEQKEIFKNNKPVEYHQIINSINIINSRTNGMPQEIPNATGASHATSASHVPGIIEPYKQPYQNYSNFSENDRIDITIDFRNNLIDYFDNEYTILTKLTNVNKLIINYVTLNLIHKLSVEPYVYICIKNINDDVFGKLIMDKYINGNCFYVSTNAMKTFNEPHDFFKLKFGFLDYKMEPIKTNNILIQKLSINKNKTDLKIYTKEPHYLNLDDKIHIYNICDDEYICELLNIIEIVDSKLFITNKPYNNQIFNNTNTIIIEKKNNRISLDISVY